MSIQIHEPAQIQAVQVQAVQVQAAQGQTVQIAAAASLSSYIVGRDPRGFWVAVETHGRAGGVFRSEQAATHYAAFETDHRPDAVKVTREPVTLPI